MGLDFELVTTRTGDGGKTSDYSGRIDWKDASVFALLGDLDELGSWLGVVKHLGREPNDLEDLQRTLLLLGSLVATDPQLDRLGDPQNPVYRQLKPLTSGHLDSLEAWERTLLDQADLKPGFVLPGATKNAAWCDVARTVCRRTERSMVSFIRTDQRPDLVLASQWLNRLSDALFVLARLHARG